MMRVGVFGASGFIGAAVAREIANRGHRVRAFARKPGIRPSLPFGGAVVLSGEPDLSVSLEGLDAIVIAVGSMGGAGMIDAHRDLPGRIAVAARALHIEHLVLVSAIGASPQAPTPFLRSKAEGEELWPKLGDGKEKAAYRGGC